MSGGEMQNRKSFAIESLENGETVLDDDGRPKRTGTLMTASAHIITAVIGSGVLSLGWAVAQLGWIAGPVSLMTFSLITFYCSGLLADCYRYPDPVHGRRNHNYIQVVKSNLGKIKCKLCGLAQYANLVGATIGYTLTASISMAAMKKSYCFHKKGHDADCHTSNNIYMIVFAIIQIVLSQIPNFHELTGLSVLAAIMSFAYSLIGIGLSIARIAEGKHVKTSLTGVVVGVDVTKMEKIWNSLQSLGNIALAFSYSQVLIEIQDTLKSSPPENKVMKKANIIGTSVITTFYMLCGILGYAAFGNNAPGNFLTGFGFYEPYWLVDIGNLCIVIHLVGAYQVFCQPIFMLVENWLNTKWPETDFIKREYHIGIPLCGVAYKINPFRVTWRALYVIVTTLIAMIFPFFNSVIGLLGAAGFFPLTVYFPVEIYLSHAKVPTFSVSWFAHKALTVFCLLISLVAAVGSIAGLLGALHAYKPFGYVS